MQSGLDLAVRTTFRRAMALGWCALFAALLVIPSVRAEEPEEEDAQMSSEKSGYSVFNPTPRQLMREFASDRPDQTESPYTIDAGHFQLDMDFANWTSGQERSNRVNEWTRECGIAPLNLKLGLLNNIDIQLVIDNYVHLRIEDRSARSVDKASRFGNVLTRLKVNLWGNDGGKTAFGIMPVIKWPLPESGLRNGKTEGGILFPSAAELLAGWDMGAMTEFDFIHNSVTSGSTYLLAENIQLDAGSNVGVTDAAYDINAFSGISVRF
jgi:hypothetical protein